MTSHRRAIGNRMAVGAALLTASAASVVSAEDLFPPPWRGQPGTTFQHWVFSTDQPGPPDVVVNNPFGAPQLTVDVIDGAWLATSDGRTGVWSLASSSADDLRFTIPLEDPPPDGANLEVYIQFAFRLRDGAAGFVGFDFPVTSFEQTPLGGGWSNQLLVLENPTCTTEMVLVVGATSGPAGSVQVDDMLIDTRCSMPPAVPAASEWGLMLMVLLLFTIATAVIRRRENEKKVSG